MARSPSAAAAQIGGLEVDAKLALLEFLLTSTDLQASARRVVDWLAAHAGVEQAVIALSEPGTGSLLLVAEHGVSSSAIVDFSLTREDHGHPLVRALERSDPVYFNDPSPAFRVPIDGPPFHAVPLRGDDEPLAHGLLLVSARKPELPREVIWVARMFSRQLSRLLSRERLAETRFGQERMLLYSIINAVTDPILLTDTEGKLIIANSHAEKLLAAPADSS